MLRPPRARPRLCSGCLGSSLLLVACLGETEHRGPVGEAPTEIPPVAELGQATPDCAGVDADTLPEAILDAPIGWASVEGDGLSATTGGAGGRVVLARTLDELIEHGGSEEPLIVLVCGLLGTHAERIEIRSNKTLFGVGVRPTIAATIEIERAENVVVRELFIEGSLPVGGSEPDAVSVRESHHVWIDHVDVSDGADGNLDITNESSFVTVSWSRFWYRDAQRAHRFSTLIGSSDTQMGDTGRLKVTLHHNWWADNVVERMPRARYGDVHVFNNYYSSVGNNYCIRSGFNARLLVEGNFFQGVSDPMVLDATGQVRQRQNVFVLSRGTRAATGDAFEPPYPYLMDLPADVPALVSGRAGPAR